MSNALCRFARIRGWVACVLCVLSSLPAWGQTAQQTTGSSHAKPLSRVRLVCVLEQTHGTPVVGARIALAHERADGTRSAWLALAATNTAGCARIPGERRQQNRVRVERLGYAPLEQSFDPASRGPVVLRVNAIATLLASRTVTAEGSVGQAGARGDAMQVAAARRLGVGNTAGLLTLLPFVQPRSARGELSVSLRGSRREQVVVTLDGLPLNDPATGLADVGDLPLAALGSVRAEPGSDALGAGPGAVGGVVALQSGRGSVASLRTGAFGERSAEGAWSGELGPTQLRIGASASSARNDFPYRTSVVTNPDGRARRLNNDLARQALFVSARGASHQLTALASRSTQGMVGAVNVRDYDADRATTTRVLVRGTTQPGRLLLGAAVRALTLDYRDPRRPVFNSIARTVSADVDARRTLGSALVVTGLGIDRLRASRGVQQDRSRGFVSVTQQQSFSGIALTSGARVDAIAGAGVLPSFSVSAEHQRATLTTGVRIAQALRAPTLYDLYFGSPQRLNVVALAAERVRYDAELYTRWWSRSSGDVQRSAQLSLVARDTRDAIVWFPGNFGWSPDNVGAERAHGVEASVGIVGSRASLRGWGTLLRSVLRAGALEIPTPYVPVQAAGAQGSVMLGPLQLGANARWLGERPYTVGPRDPRFNLPSVLLLDTSVSTTRTLSGNTDLLIAIALNNLTNQEWQSVRGFPAPTRSWSLSLSLLPTNTP